MQTSMAEGNERSMARSMKKNPVSTDGRNGQKISKRFANKTVRKFDNDIPKGKFYKKLYCSYDIHDWIFRWSWEEAKKEYETNPWPHWINKYPTLKDFYNYWSKYHKRK